MSLLYRGFIVFLSIFFPWLAFFVMDRPGVAIIALILQASLIGWIPASIWALKTMFHDVMEERKQQQEQEAQPEEA